MFLTWQDFLFWDVGIFKMNAVRPRRSKMTLTFVSKVVLTSEISCCTLTNVRITIYTVKCVWTFLTMRCKGNIFRITPNVINQNSILQYRWFIPTSHSMLRSTSRGLIKAKGWKDASRHNRIQNCMRYYVHIFNMYDTLLRVYFFIKYFLSRRIQA